MTPEPVTRIQVQVLLFSVLRDVAGTGSLPLTLDDGATGADLLGALVSHYPQMAPYRAVIRLAVNEAYEPTSIRLSDGDEVALITPVSGG